MSFINNIPSRCRSSVEKILPVIRAGFSGFDGGGDALRDVDWSYISRFAEQQRILPILYYNLKRARLDGDLPASTRTFFQKRYTRFAGINLRRNWHLTRLLGLFEDKGIQIVPYKGPVLAQRLYADSALRFYCDIDLLVHYRQLPEVWRLLHEAGYQPMEMNLSQHQFIMTAEYGNEFSFINDDGATAIDLHWKIAKHTRHPFDLDFCAARLQRILFEGCVVWGLSDEDTVLALCLNGGAHLWSHLEYILTLADLLEATHEMDWDLLLDLARRLRCERMLLLGLYLAADIFDMPVPGHIRRLMTMDKTLPILAQRACIGIFQKIQAGKFRHLYWQMRLKENHADKIRYVMRRFFVPTKKDWTARSLDGRNVYLSFILRPLKGVWGG